MGEEEKLSVFSKPKALITGISGFLGYNLALLFRDHFQLTGSFCFHPLQITGCQTFSLDLTDAATVKRAIGDLKPDLVIHTAALSHPDRCEEAPESAYHINVTGTENLLSCLPFSVRFLYISTDLVFDGEKGWYTETDPTNPLNVYACSKLEAEKRVLAWDGNYSIIRTSLMYGHGNGISNSFLQWMVRNLKENRIIPLFIDQYRTCLYVQDAAQVLLKLSRLNDRGIFHLGGSEKSSRYEFGRKFASIFGYSSDLLKPVPMREVPSLAKRAADCSLNSEKIIQRIDFKPCNVESGLQKMRSECRVIF